MNEIIKELSRIQKELKAPKGQVNRFGGYSYRSCEDILEAVKPLLNGLVLTVSDEIINLENRFYVKATAKITDGTNQVENTAFAREEEDKKGMNAAQITGAASSYARKYALNGLFCIDDTKDADATNDHGKGDKPEKSISPAKVSEERKELEEQVIILLKTKDVDKEKFFAAYDVGDVAHMIYSQLVDAIAKLKTKKDRGQ